MVHKLGGMGENGKTELVRKKRSVGIKPNLESILIQAKSTHTYTIHSKCRIPAVHCEQEISFLVSSVLHHFPLVFSFRCIYYAATEFP